MEAGRRSAAGRYLRQGRSFSRYAVGLRRFLRSPSSADEIRQGIRDRLSRRESSFAALVRDAVYGNPTSPYLPLLRRAGIECGDLEHLLRHHGVEGALGVLHDEGVRIGLDEFKGREPIRRGDLVHEVSDLDFDNPLLDPVHQTRTGGSTGNARAVQLDFRVTALEAGYVWLFQEVHDLHHVPHGMWRPVPPGSAGLSHALAFAKIGARLDRWFTQTWPGGGAAGAAERVFLHYTVAACRRWGPGLGPLERVPIDQPEPVARWLGEMAAAGTPAAFNAPASSAVRVARTAAELGLDLSGTLVRTGGEPLTDAKATAIRATGATVACNYAMTEAGRMGVGCAAPTATDDVHLFTDKLAFLQRERDVSATGSSVAALLVTTLQPACRKIMLNVEIGDYGTLEERDCGCPATDHGLRLHLHGIRSHDKLTSAGMSFLGSDVVRLVEEVLPVRFGGAVGDYQLVESEEDGLPVISVVVRPQVGPVDDDAVVEAVLGHLGEGASYKRMMATFLADGRSVRVVRREPHATGAAKVLPFHIVRG